MRSRRIAAALALPAAVALAVASGTACGSFAAEEDRPIDDPDTSIAVSDAQSPEEAATSPDTAVPEVGVDSGAARHLRVFVLTTTWGLVDTHPLPEGGIAGGRDAADLFCVDEATAAGLGGRFVAWMSRSGSDAIDRLPNDADWSMPVAGGAALLVFPSRAAIDLGQGPMQPLTRGATGALLNNSETRVWTGTSAGGRATGDDCSDWSVFASGTAGRTGTVSSSWTNAGSADCTESFHVFCFGY